MGQKVEVSWTLVQRDLNTSNAPPDSLHWTFSSLPPAAVATGICCVLRVISGRYYRDDVSAEARIHGTENVLHGINYSM